MRKTKPGQIWWSGPNHKWSQEDQDKNYFLLMGVESFKWDSPEPKIWQVLEFYQCPWGVMGTGGNGTIRHFSDEDIHELVYACSINDLITPHYNLMSSMKDNGRIADAV